jgi:hypothetical protein
MDWQIGDRVRMIHSDQMIGVIAGPVQPGVGNDGTDRVPVRWDRSGKTSEWNPGFLRPEDTNACNDPDELKCGKVVARRTLVTIDPHGLTIVQPAGMFWVG